VLEQKQGLELELELVRVLVFLVIFSFPQLLQTFSLIFLYVVYFPILIDADEHW
jgi:hypothetical protein